MAIVRLRGAECHTNGNMPAPGSQAPDFVLVNSALEDVSLEDFEGKKIVLYTVPSLDTPVCQTSARKFNYYIVEHPDTVMLIVSADLPFAMARFCGIEKLGNVIPLSMMRSRNFAKDYGVLLNDGPMAGIMARALIVMDKQHKITHTELVGEIADEPDYDQALAALDSQ